jgi:hypothetical protein
MTIKELKKILANLPDDYYACVEGGENEHGEWAKLYISPTIPDPWDFTEHEGILKY